MIDLPAKPIDSTTQAIHQILDSLGLNTGNIERAAESEAFRIDFEQNFTVEIQQLTESTCRVSTRLFSLGKSLQVQDTQLGQAMYIFTELQQDIPQGFSLGISNHDNCVRLCLELANSTRELIMGKFNEFVQIAFAYKQTYFKHKGQ